MARPLWFVALLKRLFPRIFVLARLTRVPVLGRLIERALFEGDSLTIVPRRIVVEVRGVLPAPESVAAPGELVEHFIRSTDYRWLMSFCICRESHGCRQYPRDLGCLFLGEAAMHINPALGRRVTTAEALAHVRKARELGLVHLVGRNKLDTVWLGVGPGERLLTLCNCCPCCCLWRTVPKLHPRIAAKVHRMPGVSVTVSDACEGCATCEDACFVQAIHVEDGRAVVSDDCKGCGRCADACPNGAILVSVAATTYVREAIDGLEPLVRLR